jgi:flagellar basal-body rod protein FlgB
MAELGPTVGSITPNLVLLALDMASRQHLVVATNIANANNESYRPQAVDFQERVSFYRDRLVNRRFDNSAHRILAGLRTSVETEPTRGNGAPGKVQLDAEVAQLTQNAIWYQALLAANGKSMSIVRMAIREGRG